MSFDRSKFLTFSFAGQPIGWLRPALAGELRRWPEVFKADDGAVSLISTAGLAQVVQALAAEGLITGWRSEEYDIGGLFRIERAAVRAFGLPSLAVHVNGIADGGALWIARRSMTKAVDPGMLDNLVGGGVGAGLTPEEVLVKEAWEEAGIDAALARRATRGGTLQILREVPEGVQSETIQVHDLALPAGFQPHNQDGEVAEFRLVTVDELLPLLRGELTYDATLVTLDYLKRSGLAGTRLPETSIS